MKSLDPPDGPATADADATAQLLDQFPDFPSVRGREPKQLIAGLASLDDIGVAFGAFARALLTRGDLPPTTRELVVLWVAWSRQCEYVWGGHALVASDVGLRVPPLGERWSAEHELALVVATQLLAGRLDDDVRVQAIAAWGEPGLLELAMVVGQYVLVSMVVAALALEREPGAPSIPLEWPGPGPSPLHGMAA